MFVWGKVKRPISGVSENEEEKFFYSTSAGQIVSDDGSGYVIPAISELNYEKDEFIPLDFAQKFIKEATRESQEAKDNYHQHLDRLKVAYKQSLAKTKETYENVIADMRAKALRHVEIQKQLKQQLEEQLRKEIKVQEDAVEEMRENLVEMNTQHQNEVRILKGKLQETERAIEQFTHDIDELTRHSESKYVLDEITGQVAENYYINTIERMGEDFNSNFLKLKRSLKEQLNKEKAKRSSMVQAFVSDLESRAQCHSVLNDILGIIEANESDINNKHKTELLATVNELHERHAVHRSRAEEAHKELHTNFKNNLESIQSRAQVGDCMAYLISAVIERQYEEAAAAASKHQRAAAVAATHKDTLQEAHQKELDALWRQHEAELEEYRRQLASAASQESKRQDAAEEESKQQHQNTEEPKISPRTAALNNAELRRLQEENNRLLKKLEELEAALVAANNSAAAAAAAGSAGQAPPGSAGSHSSPRLAEGGIRGSSSTDSAGELASLRQEEKRLIEQLAELSNALTAAKADLEKINYDKEVNKNDIKEWTRQFVEANDREPDNSDKIAIKDKYQSYKALSLQAKDVEVQVTQLTRDVDGLNSKLDAIKEQIVKHHQHTVPQLHLADMRRQSTARREMKECGVQTAELELAPRLRSVNSMANKEIAEGKAAEAGDVAQSQQQSESQQQQQPLTDENIIEQLEDELYLVRQNCQKLEADCARLEKENNFAQTQLADLIKEKRTDVVRRFEEDIARLEKQLLAEEEQIASLKADKTKNDVRVEELKSRAEAAEAELRERDKREQEGVNPNDEKNILKGQINKQRDAIILKSKAATAGWDAAANADEKLETEVHKAYKKGAQEERELHKSDMAALNAAIEVKENRITELMVSIGEMERRVFNSDNEMTKMKEQMETMRVELADSISSFGAMMAGAGGGGGDGEVVLGPTQAELDAAREELDAAQEELINLMDRNEKLESDLEIARKKNRIYDRLVAAGGLSASGNAGGAGAAGGDRKGVTFAPSPVPTYDLNDIVVNVKKVILKGTNLWKSNKKDDCFEVYLDCCVETCDKLITAELKNPLADSITHGRNQGAQNKQRGSVVLRKALDKFLADVVQPNLKRAEEEAAQAQVDSKRAADEAKANQTSGAVKELTQQLEAEESSYLEAGYTKESNPSNAEMSPRPEGGGSSSLLHRAKAAEDLVKQLKKQLAAVISATAEREAQQAASTGGQGMTGGASEKRGAGAAGAAGGAVAARRVAAVGAAGGGGADPAEVRKLNRKIKELEEKLKAGAAAAPAGPSAADTKAAILAEKQMQKKIKDLEAANKTQTKALEMRATKAENALAKIQGNYSSMQTELEQLKTENDKLFKITNELGSLRAKADKVEEMEKALQEKVTELAVVNDAFKKETTLRKKYKNELEDLKGAIRVYARCRPMARYELEKGCKQCVEIKDETGMKVITSRGEKDFEFDAVFSPTSTQDQVFEDTKRLVESCMDGFNVCLFAYGQTGSGKTFTMTGSPSMPGLTPKAIDELFRLIAERKHLNVKVTTYFVELYNDNLVDLYWILDNKTSKVIAEPPKLDIKMDNKKMVYIRNSVIKEVYSATELMDLFNKGNTERHTGATKMNAESSRSHSIFSIMVESYDTTSKRTTTGKLSLVDLAGSERADKTGASAERLKEAQNINKSLSALGDVIAALSEGEKFIPYRNNKLTQLMQDSLGGNAKTLMFVNFSPADYNADETSTSLMYAARVKKIVNNASKQAESAEVARLKGIIKRLMAGAAPSEVDIDDNGAQPEEPMPVIEDDGKVYDGY